MNSAKSKLRNRELLFGAWVSFSHPSITEIFASKGFDFLAIDMEHTTISLEQAQRIIAASQSFDVPCLPRPVSHSNDWIKPLLDSGADGIIAPMVESLEASSKISELIRFPPMGKRSFGVNRAHGYGSNFSGYLKTWNERSIYIAQVETVAGLTNIDTILETPGLDGVMIGPYDMSGSLGVPGETSHPLVIQAENQILAACEKFGISCGTQLAVFDEVHINIALKKGYTFIIASSDLFVLNSWAEKAQILMSEAVENLG
jgi:2-dehydro-3-deoxyglucarate aldolase